MIDPSAEVQRIIVDKLRADGGVTAIATGTYDDPPSNVSFPYVSMGPTQVLPDKADCVDGTELSIQIDAWSRKKGFEQVKKLGAAVIAALDDADDLTPTGFRVVLIELESANYLRDPDGITSHGALTFRALVDATT